jgi:predicted phage-related endonuclease
VTKSDVWKRNSGERRYFIGGSDARIIMGTDQEALVRLWREKRGEVEPHDLSGNLIVQLGLATEELNRRWYEANTGQAITDVQRRIRRASSLDGGNTRWAGRVKRHSVRGRIHAALVVF